MGSAGAAGFQHIRTLIRSGGTGPDSPLRANFQALKRAIAGTPRTLEGH